MLVNRSKWCIKCDHWWLPDFRHGMVSTSYPVPGEIRPQDMATWRAAHLDEHGWYRP